MKNNAVYFYDGARNRQFDYVTAFLSFRKQDIIVIATHLMWNIILCYLYSSNNK